jgi:FixJ family two-component response regulator
MRIKKLTKTQHREITQKIQDGVPQKTIAKEYGVAQSTISYHAKKKRTKTVTRKPKDLDLATFIMQSPLSDDVKLYALRTMFGQ